MQTIGLQGSPLSPQQARLWAWQKKNLVSRTLCAVQIQGVVQREGFRLAVGCVVERHEILHTLFYTVPGMDVPVQVVGDPDLWSWSEISLEQLEMPHQLRTIDDLFTSLQKDVCAVQPGSLFHFWLFRFAADRHVFVISVPALCADNSSSTLFLAELARACAQKGLTEEVLQYADVSAWQEEVLSEEEKKPEREYWQKTDLSHLTSMPLPFENEERHVKSENSAAFVPEIVTIPLPDGLALQIEMLAQHSHVSAAAVLLTCWHVLLWRLSGEPTGVVGVACDGRNYAELANALGLYTRFVPIRAHFEHDRPFEMVLAALSETLQEATERQEYFSWEQGNAPMESDARIPFFPVSFEYDVWPETFKAGEMTFSFLKRWSCSEPFALKLSVVQVGEHFQIEVQYDPHRMREDQVHHLAALLRTLLHAAVSQPQTLVSTLPLIEQKEQRALLRMGRAASQERPHLGLHQLFEDQVQQQPHQLAVLSTQDHLTYQQLNVQANRLAQVLRHHGVGPDVLVGFAMTRSAQMLVGLLAILKAGGAYLPLDPTTPQTRLSYQLNESGAVLLLTQREVHLHLPSWTGETLCLEDLEPELAGVSEENLPSVSEGDALAYVIYTSGSTGRPKGVMIRQSSVVNYTLAMGEVLGAEPGWQYATVSTVAADLGNTAIFCALASGGCVQVLDTETITTGAAMAAWTQQHPFDVLKIVPSHLAALVEGEQGREMLPQRALIMGGEVLPVGLLERLGELEAGCAVYNHYGPTETTIGVLIRPLGVMDGAGEQTHMGKRVPLGPPLSNSEAYVLDQRMQLVPMEVTGELYLGGAGLARGYLKQPEQTAERFVPHPFSQEAGARLYRTGDLVLYREEGQMEFVGRGDGQVKLRGYRIEVGEIEEVLRRHPQVRSAVVVLREDRAGEPRLVSYVVARQPISREEVREFLQPWLPDSMLPTQCVQLAALPLTSNGKVDRQRLPMPDLETERASIQVVNPRGPIEEMVVAVWKDLLGVSVLSIHDNFFALGGHSLLATRVIARTQGMLQVTLPVQMLFDAPTVAAFAHRIEQALQDREGSTLPPLVAGERPEKIPLSFAQQRLWFLDQLEPGSTAYLASRAGQFLGKLHAKALEQSIEAAVHRHESLRTTFEKHADQPVQVIHPRQRFSLPVIDLQGLQQEQRMKETQRLTRQEAENPCDLARGPLLRASLLRREMYEHVLLLTLHHIITDGWSNGVLMRELATLYQAFVSGLPSSLVPLPLQYADYALWQQVWLQGEILEAQLTYWRKQLADMAPLELFTDYSRLVGQSYRGSVLSIEIPQEVSQQLIVLSQQENVTVFMLLLTAFQVLLMRYTGKNDIHVSTPIANRTRAEIENIIGFFVNTLVLRTNLSGNPTFLHLLQQVREVCLEAYAHQDVPFEKVVETLQIERDVSKSSFFQVSFQLIHEDVAAFHPIPGLRVASSGMDGASADYALRVQVTEIQQQFSWLAFYDTNLFEAQTIQRFLEHFQRLLQEIVFTPEKPIAVLPLLSEEERYLQLVHWNTTQADVPQGQCVHQLFEQQVERTPEAVALVFEEQVLTYAQLNRQANQLAYQLQRRDVGPDTLVGICMERSLEMVVALFGVLKAGGAYVPLDPSLPQERLEYMLADAQIVLVLSQRHLQQRLAFSRIQIIPVEAAIQAYDNVSQWNPTRSLHPDQLIYTLYTSGSTGKPKGAMNIHRGLVNRLTWMQRYYPLRVSDRVVQKTPFSFDVSVWEFFWPLMTGARLVMAQPGGHQDPIYLKELIRHEQITTIHFVPAMLQAFLSEPTNLQSCSSLRQVMCSGEALSAQLQAHFFALAPGSLTLHNLYGPTEASIDVTFWDCLPDEHKQSVPIGRPIANTQIYLLDRHMQLVPVGVVAEVYIGGSGLARGYLHRADLTAERFVPHPFCEEPGVRLYKTGDLARYVSADGDLDYVGRMDHQIKIRGYRVELGEIEAALHNHPAIQDAVVLSRKEQPDDSRLVAYIVLKLLDVAEATSPDIHVSLSTERLKRWQQLYDETYQQKAPQDVQVFNIVGWNSSYTGQPIAAEEMHAWLGDTLALVRSYHPERIWEIGCGTGLLLLPLAQECIHYYGTDFSAPVLKEVRQQLVQMQEKQGIHTSVSLFQQQADDFRGLPEGQIDTILINSVVQYFPDVQYLLRVLEGALRVVTPGGRIIVGDVRSFPLLEAFHANVQLYHAPETLTRQQLRLQVQQQVQREEELTIDPTFFWRWAQNTGRVQRVEVRLKRGRYLNEMTQFRYQVVLHVGEPKVTHRAGDKHLGEKEEELNWSEQAMTRERLRQKLTEEQPKRLRLRQVPNARVELAVQTLLWLKSESGPETVGKWQADLHTRAQNGIEPEDLWEQAEHLGYHAIISWGQHERDGSYTVLMHRKDDKQWIDTEEELLQQPNQHESGVNWQRYVNQPLREEMQRLLIPQIRQYLREQLPEYMLPTSIMVLKALPLTPNGKVDRRMLLAIEENHSKEPKELEEFKTEIEKIIGQIWNEVLGHRQIGRHDNFFESGGHSLLATQVIARIRTLIGVEVPLRSLFETPTLAGFARRIEQYIRESAGIVEPPLRTEVRPEVLPLSFAQQRLWFLDQLEPGNVTYLNPGVMRLQGMLNSNALERSLSELVCRHEILRTTIAVYEGQLGQVIHASLPRPLLRIDLRGLKQQTREEAAQQLAFQESHYPCDLEVGPLLRTSLLQLATQEYLLLLTMHHIITDGWSYGVFEQELVRLYQAFVAGQPSPLPPLLIQYADYALWQRQWLQGDLLQKHRAYWQHQLEGASPLELPFDVSHTPVRNDHGARYSFVLPMKTSRQLMSLSRQEGTTLFMTLLTVFQILLYRLTGQTDIVVGTDIANRTHVETEELIGFFVNLLALRTEVRGSSNFRTILQQVRGMVLSAYAHQELPFEMVVEHLGFERKKMQTPLIHVLFVLQNTPQRAWQLSNINIESHERNDVSARFDLALFLQEEPGGITGSVVYRRDNFEEQTIALWMHRFELLLRAIVTQPETVIERIEISTDEEKVRKIREKGERRSVRKGSLRATKAQEFEIE